MSEAGFFVASLVVSLLALLPVLVAGVFVYAFLRWNRGKKGSKDVRRRVVFLTLLGGASLLVAYLQYGQLGMGGLLFVPVVLLLLPILSIWAGLEILWLVQEFRRR